MIMSRETANGAAANSNPISTQSPSIVRARVLAVQDHGIVERVYDLTVDGEHEFFASGILVHNCVDALRYAVGKLIKRKGKSYYDY